MPSPRAVASSPSFAAILGRSLEEKRRVAFLVLVPVVAFEFGLAQLLLHGAFIVKLLEIALQLAVVAPEAEVVRQVHAYHAGLDHGLAPWPIGEFFEEGAAEIEAGARILPHVGDAVFGSDGGDLDHRVAPDGATGAAPSTHRVLPRGVAEEERRIVRPVGDPVQVVGLARPCRDGMRRRPPHAPLAAFPARARVVELRPRLRCARHDVLIVRPEE